MREGDYIVHINHGVGQYLGTEILSVPTGEGSPPIEREFLVLGYRNGDKLMVPPDQIDRIHLFSSASQGVEPTLDKLHSANWSRTLSRAQQDADAVAEELLHLYAARVSQKGYAYGPDTPEQARMEAAFAYAETPDQMASIRDIKRDLESPRPMDRLLIGDVGYGKTEVALRAAFKVAQARRQVAVLCPTSVLATQHFHTFSERFADFPIRIALLSRMTTAEEQKATIEGIAEGTIDIVIGTHRLLSPDVTFKALGLVIIDEEQRFGVAHKETLKQLRKSVDVLSMTATPIPRTLDMAMTGVLDASVIADPPQERIPIETVVAEDSDGIVREALERELARGGQAYYLHNRIETIESAVARLQGLFPEARIGLAHGQMDEETLEEAMTAFYEHRTDILVCTTIIETGLDVSNANTIIVEDADRLGLAQLHQLRGRVGRSDRQAYALLLYPRGQDLAGIPRERLRVLEELTDPGAGYRIAERDLSLRGAGSLLGLEQSGSTAINSIGYPLYFQLLDQSLRKRRGQKADPQTVPLPAVELSPGVLVSGIPAEYMADATDRLDLYSAFSAVRRDADLDGLIEKTVGQYGPLPAGVEGLVRLTRLRLRCLAAGVKSITESRGEATLFFRKDASLSVSQITALQHEITHRGVTLYKDRATIHLPQTEMLEALEEVVTRIAKRRRTRGERGTRVSDGQVARWRPATEKMEKQ